MLQPIPNKQSSTSVCIQAQLAENFKVMKLHISLDEGLPSPDLVTTCSLLFRDQPHIYHLIIWVLKIGYKETVMKCGE